MEKYRIRITTFKDGCKHYLSQVKLSCGVWCCLDFDGKPNLLYEGVCYDRKDALSKIDKHYNKGYKKNDHHF